MWGFHVFLLPVWVSFGCSRFLPHVVSWLLQVARRYEYMCGWLFGSVLALRLITDLRRVYDAFLLKAAGNGSSCFKKLHFSFALH